MSHHSIADQPGIRDSTMLFASWLRNVRSTLVPSREQRNPRRQRPGRGRAIRRLALEQLEDRSLPSGSVSLAPSAPAPQLVGERVTWMATAADVGTNPVYQFSAAAH